MGAGFPWATKMDGTLWAWGYNHVGQLGLNDVANRSSPIQIPGTTWNTVVNNGSASSYAVKTDGTLWSVGNGGEGELGVNSRTDYSSPVQIPGTTWGTGNKISAGLTHVHAIKTDGTMWAWGDNAHGTLGVNSANPVKYSSPVQIPGSDWATVTSNHTGGAAIKTNGTLWAWGYNAPGTLGDNSAVSKSSPVQVPGTTWSKVFRTGPYSYGAIKTDGTLWAWGDNDYGSLGNNSRTNYSSPIQIPGTNWANGVSSASSAAFAVKSDGTGWKWGRNEYGQLGLNNRNVHYSSPTQIPGIWDVDNVQVRSNAGSALAMK